MAKTQLPWVRRGHSHGSVGICKREERGEGGGGGTH